MCGAGIPRACLAAATGACMLARLHRLASWGLTMLSLSDLSDGARTFGSYVLAAGLLYFLLALVASHNRRARERRERSWE